MIWLEWQLMFTFVLFGMGWWWCCCGGGIPGYSECVACSGTGNNAPQYVTVVFAGIAGGLYEVCENYNGTWVIENDAGCVYKRNITPTFCPQDPDDTNAIWFYFVAPVGVPPVGNYTMSAQIRCYDSSRGFTATYTFTYDTGDDETKLRCLTFVDQDLPTIVSVIEPGMGWLDVSGASGSFSSGDTT